MIALGDVLGAARILVVDDERANVRMFDRLLTNAGCQHVAGVTDPRDTIARLTEIRPDLLILDLHMPHMDGFEVMQAIRPLLAAERYLPVLIVTADDSPTVKQRALAMGARDFLAKPFDSVEALLRIRNLLVTRQLYAQLEREQQQLEQAVFERTRALHSTHLEIVERLARAAEYRDDNTGEHTRRVGRLAGLLARTLGLSEADARTIQRAAPLHDVGKVGVPDAILLKPAALSPGEFDIIKTHAIMGAKILSGSRVPLLRMAEEIALTHHERWDGRGYPNGRVGEGIPLAGRIVALADAFDAMTHDRPYQRGLDPARALEVVRDERARHFDPQVVDAFKDVFDHYVGSLESPSDDHARAAG
jgi:putative two-component system response regulator